MIQVDPLNRCDYVEASVAFRLFDWGFLRSAEADKLKGYQLTVGSCDVVARSCILR